jgi:SAM-dependent methyltransferase/cell division protein FtsB
MDAKKNLDQRLRIEEQEINKLMDPQVRPKSIQKRWIDAIGQKLLQRNIWCFNSRVFLSERTKVKIFSAPIIGSVSKFAWALLNIWKDRRDARMRLLQLEAAVEFNKQNLVETAHQIDALHQDVRASKVELEALKSQIGDLRGSVSALSKGESFLRTQIRVLERKLSSPGEKIVNPIEHEDPTSSQKNSKDKFIKDFELTDVDGPLFEFAEHFRGEFEDIQNRLKVYLDHLKRCHVVSNGLPVIDLGCGRGEWISLLNGIEINNIGVDKNPYCIEFCTSNGLNVVNEDAFDFLDRQDNKSVGAVTGFQFLEHIPFSLQLRLFEICLEKLAPGGIVVFELPNPENLQVGGSNFFKDPTHSTPLFPDVLAFFLKNKGFVNVELLRVNAYPDAHRLSGKEENITKLNKLLYGPQDYAVIAHKSSQGGL